VNRLASRPDLVVQYRNRSVHAGRFGPAEAIATGGIRESPQNLLDLSA
jgi:hypothetical protein